MNYVIRKRMLKMTNLKRVLASFFVVTWMSVVFIFSSQDGEQTLNTSGAVIYTIDKTINGNDTQVESYTNSNETDTNKSQEYEYSDELQKFVRKNAHFILYTIGGVIISVFFMTFGCEKRRLMLYTILTGFLYALSDEFHQLFVVGRTSSFLDVMIDTSGVIVGFMLFYCFFKIFNNKQKKKDEFKKQII